MNKANTVFNIREEDIQDGTQIAIGNKLIVLKVGADSKVDTSKLTVPSGASLVTVTLDKGCQPEHRSEQDQQRGGQHRYPVPHGRR